MKRQNSKRRKPADGSVRRSQVLTRAGPGAIVDLVDHAVVIKGLDSWNYTEGDESFIPEPRLERQALAALRNFGGWPHSYVRLRRPPRCEEDDPHPARGMHAREFPGWYLCRLCRSLVKRDALDNQRRHTCYADEKIQGQAVPIRFVAACPRGHLQDIHWRGFVHYYERDETVESPLYCHHDNDKGTMVNTAGKLFLGELALVPTGSTGDLSDLIVRCRRCGATRGLQDLRMSHAVGKCQGWRPWLRSNDDGCEAEPRLLIRTGTNAWFPLTMSVLSIPSPDEDLRRAVTAHWGSLKKVESLERLKMLLDMLDHLAEAFREWDPYEVLQTIRRRRNKLDQQAPIRQAEWQALTTAEPGAGDDLPPKGERWFARHLDTLDTPDFLKKVVLVHALCETRALIGFTRLESIQAGQEGDLHLEGHQMAALAEEQDWVPAVEILGEGVFLQFDEEALKEWESRDAVQQRAMQFRRGLTAENKTRDVDVSIDLLTSARLVMLHSLAHMLITAISLECGYSASAIRERIYCYVDPEDPEKSRAGILLYTGTPGSEGTLGGLIEVGKSIVDHLRRAVRDNLICSNDPVCAQHRPDGPEDGRRREGAACHGCLLIAEPSCERMNRDLDRALVVPTLESADAAFLRDWVQTA